MNVIYFMLPLALVLGFLFIGLFVWATRSGQYDDLETPSRRILFDDDISYKRKGDS